MPGSMRILPFILVAGLAELALTSTRAAGDEIDLADAKVFIEWNSTANDFGIHFFWDGVAWKSMTVTNESGKQVLDVGVRRT